MIKIKDDSGKVKWVVEDESTEPKIVMQPSFTCPKCYTDWEHGGDNCPTCDKKEGK